MEGIERELLVIFFRIHNIYPKPGIVLQATDLVNQLKQVKYFMQAQNKCPALPSSYKKTKENPLLPMEVFRSRLSLGDSLI
ncbi:MAG: hypothetical protein H7X88_03200 [Gloeobacteraceae cyanobacterium ES-bin-316]|nr:hypothetical protein [Ferruginibacter sp.]